MIKVRKGRLFGTPEKNSEGKTAIALELVYRQERLIIEGYNGTDIGLISGEFNKEELLKLKTWLTFILEESEIRCDKCYDINIDERLICDNDIKCAECGAILFKGK